MASGRLKLRDRSVMKVTIGLCFKNAEKTIRECLDKVLNQDYPHEFMEIIMVDGKSIDNTAEIAKSLVSKSNISSRLYSDNGKGLGHARQIVLEKAKGKYVVWVDCDVLIARDFVRKQVEFMEKNPQAGVATGKYTYREGTYKTLISFIQGISKYLGSIEYTHTKEYRGLPPNDASIYRVEAAKQVGGFDENIRGAAEDEDIIIRMRNKGWIILVNQNARFYAYTRGTWRGIWEENAWFGYGKHFIWHKHRNLLVRRLRIPLIDIYIGTKASLKAYRITHKKKVFFIPLVYFFSTLAWWSGFARAHFAGYGHKTV